VCLVCPEIPGVQGWSVFVGQSPSKRASRPLVISVINDIVDYYDKRLFCRGKVIGKVMVNKYSIDRDIHAYLIVEIGSVFKGWMDIVKTRLGLSAIW